MPTFEKTRFDFQKEITRLDFADRGKTELVAFKECQPKLLVVTDSLSYSASNDFGLTQFVATLASSTIHGMTPSVIKAARGLLAGADITSFKFDDSAHGLLKSRYDVVFILGFDSEGGAPGVGGQVTQSEIDAIARFMQAGGGVFATGDHESLGAAISRDIPRVREMRFWKQSNTPNVASELRLSTNMSGSNEVEDFEDQSDALPQTLYPNFRTKAGNPGVLGKPALAHPLLQLPATPAVAHPVIEVFPDHPHEGECRVPSNLSTTFTLDGSNQPEWPAALAGGALPPEIVAMTMSHGSGFPFGPTGPKTALTPRAFISICAYDGQRADVGRVVTDATWHHFVNVNLDGAASGLSALRPGSPPTDSPALLRIRQYYRNLATWLMPAKTRRCLRFPLILAELARFPLFEELVIPGPPNPPDPAELVLIGEQLVNSLSRRLPSWEVEALATDALAEALGDEATERLLSTAGKLGTLSSRALALGALGAITTNTVKALPKLESLSAVQPHETFEHGAQKSAKTAVMSLIEASRRELRDFDATLAKVLGSTD
ncbi:MAG TPA: hypothetical protein VER04_17805 [Polyangiaceae bacterium]|nr:hypothetical protein [Polyangiaceae bacterium]